jgi:hypothetical protein
MSGIFGQLNISDTDRVFQATTGQDVIYQAAADYLARVNADLNAALTVFLGRTTEDHKLRYKLPGGGRLQTRGPDGTYGATKATGQWDIAFPLLDFGAQSASNDVDRAYMTVEELDRHINTIVIQNTNTTRFQVLKPLFNNVQQTFVDQLWGSLSIEPLANGDTVVYPPVLGSESEATDDHYLEAAYATASISDTNNPYETIVEELVEHFGESTGGDNIVVFINPAEASKTMDLTDFTEVPDQFVRSGDNVDIPERLPSVPGKIIGRMTGKGACWVSQWRWIPATYMLAIHMEEEQPLMRRVDPADTGLPRGLNLVATDEAFPFRGSFWRNRFGLGGSNRLNGVALQLDVGGDGYDIPSAYS